MSVDSSDDAPAAEGDNRQNGRRDGRVRAANSVGLSSESSRGGSSGKAVVVNRAARVGVDDSRLQ